MLAANIRLASRRDAPDLIDANLSNRDFHAPWVAPFTDQAGFDSWFNRTLVGPNISFAARETNSLEIVGVINISEIVMGAFQSAYLGYYGTAQFARKGLMADAFSQAIKYAFDDLGLHRLEANIQTGNMSSQALVKKLFFNCEGVSKSYLKINGEWHDHQRWALLNQ